jgi:hypothetical protein
MPRLRRKPAPNALIIAAAIVCGGAANHPLRAQQEPRIENQMAVFAALDKVTARISRIEIKLGDTVKFGALRITPLRCYSRPPDVEPKTSTFVVVKEVLLDKSEKRIFSGWMFAENPGVNAVEHPVYDVWLTECASPSPKAVASRPSQPPRPSAVAAPAAGAASGPAVPPAAPPDQPAEPRRRPPR